MLRGMFMLDPGVHVAYDLMENVGIWFREVVRSVSSLVSEWFHQVSQQQICLYLIYWWAGVQIWPRINLANDADISISIMQILIHIQIIMQIPINQVKRLLPYHSHNYPRAMKDNWSFFERDINADHMIYKTVHYHSIHMLYTGHIISFCANIFLYGVTLSKTRF